jgi:hypothetical protein
VSFQLLRNSAAQTDQIITGEIWPTVNNCYCCLLLRTMHGMATLRVLLWPNSCREAATGTPLNYLWYVTSCFSSVVCLHRQCLFEWPPLLHFFKFRISNILCKTIFSTPSIHLSKAHLHLTQRPRKRNKVSPIINLRRSMWEEFIARTDAKATI